MIPVKFGGFWQTLAVSTVLAAVLYATYPQSFHPLFALGLVAFASAGYFALQSLSKAGFSSPKAEGAVIACSLGCLLLASLYNSSLQLFLPLLFLPITFSVAAVVSLTSSFALQISG